MAESIKTGLMVEALTGHQLYAEWQGAYEALITVKDTHPTKGSTKGFDISKQTHIEAQSLLNRSNTAEKSARQALQEAIADPKFNGLDIIAKLATLHALQAAISNPSRDEIEARNSAFHEAIFRPARASSILPDDLTIEPGNPKVPTGVQGVVWHAEIIDRQLRVVDATLKDGSEVKVVENEAWSEFRTLRRAGHREQFYRTVTRIGLVASKDASFRLEHPVVDETGVLFAIPSSLTNIETTSLFGDLQKDIKYIGEETETRLSVNGNIFQAPLVALMRATGRDKWEIKRFNSGKDMEGNYRKTTVSIDGVELSNNPLE